MSLWTAIRSIFGSTGAPRQDAGVQANAPFRNNDLASAVSFESAMQISAVWAAIRLVAETIASLPFDILERDTGEPARNMALRTLLKYRPNDSQTPVEFWESVLLNLVSSGNAYCIKVRRDGGQLAALKPVSSQQMETELLADGVTVVHRYTSGAVTRVFAADSVWHIKLFGNGLVGMSPLSYGAASIGIAQAADGRVSKIYSNGAKPAGVLMIDHVLTDEQRAQIRKSFKDLATGSDDRLFVLEADMSYKQVSMSPQDIQLLESRRFQIEDIGRFFGVPSVLLNQTAGNSALGSNVNEIMTAFYKLNLRPYLEKIESSIVRWLIRPAHAEKYEPRFDFDAILQLDGKARAEMNREKINSGQITLNEARADEGRRALPGGDVLMVQGAMIPAKDAGKKPEPPAPPPLPESEPDDEGKSLRPEPSQIYVEPRISVTLPEIRVSSTHQLPEVKVDNHFEKQDLDVKVSIPEMPTPVFEVTMPETKQAPPPVHVEVAAPQVTVVDSHPDRAVQRVERDQNGDVIQTVIDYEKG